MKIWQLLFAPTCVFLTAFQTFGQAQCPGTVETVRYHSAANSQIVIPIMINHSGPYEFLLDTGAQISFLEPSLAEELNLKPQAEINVISVSAKATARLVSLDLVEVGSVSVRQPIAAVQSMEQLKRIDPGIRGLLGGNFLGHFDVLLDYAHKLLCFDDSGKLRESVRGERVPMLQHSAGATSSSIPEPILISARLPEDRSSSTILKLDSGTNASVLFSKPLEIPIAATVGAQARRGAVSGGTAQFFAVLPVKDVQIGPHTWVEVKFVAPVNGDQNTGRGGMDGLLSTQLFKRVLISYTAGYVVFNPR